MEVHHPHHLTHKKKWTEYLLEFLMLFLAVFLGFMAENQREHIIENNREKQFMSALVRDLELDTIQFSAIKKWNASRLALTDSLIVFFVSHPTEKAPAVIYSNSGRLIQAVNFYQNSGTLDQLKNSGGLRLIRKRIVVDSINAYDQQVKRLVIRDKIESDEAFKTVDIAHKLFEWKELSQIFVDTMLYEKSRDIKSVLVPLNKAYINEYMNYLRQFRSLLINTMGLRDRITLKAANLISLIKKKYNLE